MMGESQFIAYKYDEDAADYGSEAWYYPHALLMGGQWWGIKAYKTAGERERAYKRQTFASINGFGPTAGSRVRVLVRRKGRKPIIRHGYYTAQCRPIHDVARNEAGYEIDDPRIERVKKIAGALGIKLRDDSARNYGWWMGSVVLLDFGDWSYLEG